MRTDTFINHGIGVVREGTGSQGIFSVLVSFIKRKEILLLLAAFLIGRTSIAGGLLPFGFAFYAAVCGSVSVKLLIAIPVILGMATSGSVEQIYITVAAMIIYSALNILFKSMKSRVMFKQACLAFAAILVPQLVMTWLQGFLIFDVLRALFTSFVVFVVFFIFKNAAVLVDNPMRKTSYSSEEMISLAITAGLMLAGFGNFRFLGFSPRNIFCTMLILLFSYKCGAGVGASAGVAIGLTVCMSTTAAPLAIGSYAFCGLLSGVFRGLGRIGSGLGFVLGNAVLTIYMNGSEEVLVYLKEILISLGIFMLLPQKFIDFATEPFNREIGVYSDKRGYTRRVRDITVDRLDKFSRAFKELSKTFSEISETKVAANKGDISVLFDRVADRVCKDCSLCLYCWDRNFYTTYQVMFNIVETLEEKGYIEERDIPAHFMDKCERLNDFVDAVNNVYELFRVDMIWKSRIGESRGLISQQFDGLSKVISGLADEINVEVTFYGDLEDELFSKLITAGLRPREVVVFKNKNGKFEANILHKGCGGSRVCVSHIEKLVSEVLGKKMTRGTDEYCTQSRDGNCLIKFSEAETLRITTGVARLSKHESSVSGDSYTFLNNGKGKYVIALSDGMGSGQKAAAQSKASVGLLENFMESGFDKDMALKLINSVLVLKSGDDSFSTIDVSIIDLYNGDVEFIKTGAAPTYIKRAGKVETVRSASLPAGILGNIETELIHKKVESGDLIVMVTDGITDSFKSDEPGDKALVRYLQEVSGANPQQIAEGILNEAFEAYEKKPGDDMTVLVAKVWKGV